MAETLAEAAQNGWLVLESGAALHLYQSTYFAVRDALRAYFMLNEEDDAAVRHRAITQRLRSHMPSVAAEAALLSLFGINTTQWEATPRAARHQQIIDSLVWLTIAESRRQPVIWAIEDLQWADAETEAFLIGLVPAIVTSPVVIMLNHRPEYRPTFAAADNCVTLQVNRLANQALQRLLDEILGADPSLQPLKQALAEHTGGNPFFVEECVRTLLESGTLSGSLGSYSWTGEISKFTPTSVQDVLSARIDMLRPEAKRLLQSAAVMGNRIDPVVLQRLTQSSDLDFRNLVSELCASGFLVRSLHFSGTGYQFVHTLSQDVAYRSLLLESRRQLHARAVDVLEAVLGGRVSDQAEVLANHALVGQQWAKAAYYYRNASRSALSQFACEVAVAQGREALNALDKLPDETSRRQAAYDIRLDLRNALFPLARHSEMLEILKEAEELAISLDDISRQARAAAHLCHCYWLSGYWPDAVAAGERALALAGPTEDLAILVWARFFKALAHYSLGEFDSSISLLRKNTDSLTGDMQVNRFGGFTLPFVVGADWLGCCLSERGEFAAALECTEAGLQLAERAGYPFDLVHGLLGVAGVHLMRGTVPTAVPLLEHALSLCDNTKVVSVRPRVLALLAFARALSCQIDDALEMGERATREAQDHGALRILCQRWFAEVLLVAGHAEEALETSGNVLETARESGQLGLLAWTLRLSGEAKAAHGEFVSAHQSLEEALALARSLCMPPLTAHCHRALGVVARAQGRLGDAEREADKAQVLYRALCMRPLPSWQQDSGHCQDANPGVDNAIRADRHP
jgi:tetratricopeptide (TPR) repeat protein